MLTGALIFIHVGTETATSGWIATYALRLGELQNLPWGIGTATRKWPKDNLKHRSLVPSRQPWC